MIKLIGSIIILASSTAVGVIVAKGYSKRVSQLKELIRVINYIENQVRFTYTPLPEAFLNGAERSEGVISSFLKEASQLLVNNSVNDVLESFKSSINSNRSGLYLNDKDIDVIMNFGKTIGESDVEGEKRVFSLTLLGLKDQHEEALEAMKKNSKMYKTLGFTIGAMVVIILL